MTILRAKDVEFDVTYVNLQDKPDWFLEISPRGKVPVLKVDDDVLFESNAICEFLDEMVPPRLHPEDPIKRARNRAWTDFVADFAGAVTIKLGYAKSAEEVEAALPGARKALGLIEEALEKERDALGETGPWFNGAQISLVDAAYAPFLQRLTMVEPYLKTGLLSEFPRVAAWTEHLLSSDLVTKAVPDNFPEEFAANHQRRGSYVATLMEAERAAAE